MIRDHHHSRTRALRRWLAGVIAPDLRTEAERDPLTDLYNLRADQRLVHKALALRRREGESGDVLVRFRADMDNFKAFNDTHGHTAGDRVLALVGRILRNSIREGEDIVSPARVGGDEFAMTLLIPASASPDRIRDRLEQNVAEALRREGFHRAGPLEVGVSIGFAVARPDTMPHRLDAEADTSARRRKTMKAGALKGQRH